MVDSTAYLQIREGAFTYLLAADPAASIEHRSSEALEVTGGDSSLVAAWYRAGDERVPVVRLGAVMGTEAAGWEHAVVLAHGDRQLALAAERVQLIPKTARPAIQRFNPAGCSLPGGSVITGLCPGTRPEYLVLDAARLHRCLLRAAQA